MKAIILAGVFLLGLGSIALAGKHQPHQKPIRAEIKARYAQLNLSSDQAQALKGIRMNYLKERAQIQPGADARKAHVKLRMETRKKVNEVLHPEQQEIARRLRAERRQRPLPDAHPMTPRRPAHGQR
jgi:Spy/CpxP family protein refolding chaperone